MNLVWLQALLPTPKHPDGGKGQKNCSVGTLQASNWEYDKHAEVSLVSRGEDKLDKKVFKIILLFKTLFRNIQIHYLVRKEENVINGQMFQHQVRERWVTVLGPEEHDWD